MTYTYDVWGNLTEKKIYAYTTATDPGTPISTISYGYSTGEWNDQLTSYDGQTIVYDAMGNPTSYRGKGLAWHGKQLTGVSGGTHDYSFTYDSNGLRQQKTEHHTDPEDDIHTNYYYNGSVLIGLVKGNDTLRFSYDAAGNAAAVDHNGTYYYYLRNGQGDIVKLIDGSGATVVEYIYDSWGKPLSCTGTLATTLGALNPFRYRGYVYDEETGFYYLKSRYYDPETCRFVSADVLLSTGQGVLGHNCFAYCLNNPANGVDPYGSFSWGQALSVIAIVAVAAVAIAATVATAGAAGAAVGAVAGTYISSTAICSAVTTAVTVGGYATATGIAACALSDVGEVCLGTNVIRDYICGGDQLTYDLVEESLFVVASCYYDVGSNYVPREAYDTYDYASSHNGSPRQGYKGGKTYENRNGKLPYDSTYKEYDIYPHVNGQSRGSERIVISNNNNAWYTRNHYKSFIQFK